MKNAEFVGVRKIIRRLSALSKKFGFLYKKYLTSSPEVFGERNDPRTLRMDGQNMSLCLMTVKVSEVKFLRLGVWMSIPKRILRDMLGHGPLRLLQVLLLPSSLH